MGSQLTVYVDVDGEASHPDDEEVAGFYAVTVTLKEGVQASGLSAEALAEIASAVKDEFHDKIGIKVLDDFEITLVMADETEIDDDGFDGETGLVVLAEFEGKADRAADGEPDVYAMVVALDEMQAKVVLAGLLDSMVELGFHKDDPINGGDCVDAMSVAYRTAMHSMKGKAGEEGRTEGPDQGI